MTEESLSFFKTDLNKILYRGKYVIKNVEDFWLFVKKYEAVRSKSKTRKSVDELYNDLKSKVELTEDEKAYFSAIDSFSKRFPRQTLLIFKVITLAYLNFKKSEEQAKLKKLKEFQENLPVFQYKEEIVQKVTEDKVVIVAGDTGCGKSTQVPQYLLQAGFNKIACTQPRRIACISLCKRVAYETLNEYGAEIGYQIRFERQKREETKILFITEGLLLRQVSGDGMLSGYDVVLLDEVHERHLHADFLLGVLKCLLLQREDLKLVLMSATININLFADYFGGNASIIQVPGRLHPITVNYMPVMVEEKASKSEKIDPSPYLRIMQMIDEKYPKTERGDVLVFVSGLSEIQTLVDAANQFNDKAKSWIVLPLHSSLSLAEQDKVFDYPPEGFRKFIVGTNIAETSVTIDGVRFVVDSGRVKEMSYDPACRMSRLKECWVSKASAEQRKGRAGRTGPGVCYRLFSESDYQALTEYSAPEIQRVPLDSVLLQMVSMGLPDCRKFPFLEAPHPDALENAILALKQHGALSEDERLTPAGALLSRLPVDLPLGKMLLSGSMFHQIEPALSLAAALSVQSPYTPRSHRDPDAMSLLKEVESDHGDPITLLTMLREWLEVKQQSRSDSRSQSSRQWCRSRGLEEQRFYEIVKLRSQFKDLLKDCKVLEDDQGFREGMSSGERALRHGELKILKRLKREEASKQGPQRKKYLKPDTWTVDDPSESAGPDTKDIEFRLRHDHSKIQNLLSGSTACSYKDLTLLKVILLNGLYPQIAIPDEFNHCKGVSEKVFHTMEKPFVFLHPMSVLTRLSEALALSESDLVEAQGFCSRRPLSSKHQLLTYTSLLETNRPYLVNTMRLPLAQSLLLVSKELHTNSDFTVIICDSWVKLRFPVSRPVEKLLLMVSKVRKLWQDLLKLKLEEQETGGVEGELSEGLLTMMKTEIAYGYERVVGRKGGYKGPGAPPAPTPSPFPPYNPVTSNPTLGGVFLTPYLTYDCLEEAGPGRGVETTNEMWRCEHCGLAAPLNALERLQHSRQCLPAESDTNNQELRRSHSGSSNSKSYNCSVCNRKLFLTPIEILKHKKSHS